MKKVIVTIIVMMMVVTGVSASSAEFKRVVKITDVAKLEKLSKSNKSDVLQAVAMNPNTPVHILTKLADSKNKDVLIGVAFNDNTSIEILNKLAKHKDYVISITAKDTLRLIINYVDEIKSRTKKLDMFLDRSKNVPKTTSNFKNSISVYDLRKEEYTKNFYDKFIGRTFVYNSVNDFGDKEFKYLKAETAMYLLLNKETDEDKIRLLTSKYKYALKHGGDFHYTQMQTFFYLPGSLDSNSGPLSLLIGQGMMTSVFNINIGDVTRKNSKINYSVDAKSVYVNLTAYLGNNDDERKDMRRNILLSLFIFNKGYEAEIYLKNEDVVTGYDLRAYYLLPKFYDLLKKGDDDAAKILTFLAKKQYKQLDRYLLRKKDIKTVFDGVSKNILK